MLMQRWKMNHEDRSLFWLFLTINFFLFFDSKYNIFDIKSITSKTISSFSVNFPVSKILKWPSIDPVKNTSKLIQF